MSVSCSMSYNDLVFEIGKSDNEIENFKEFALMPNKGNMIFNNLKKTGHKKSENSNLVYFKLLRYYDIFIRINSITDSHFIKNIKLYDEHTNEIIKDIALNTDIIIPLCSKKYQHIPFEICVEYIDADHVPDNVDMIYSGAYVNQNIRSELDISLD